MSKEMASSKGANGTSPDTPSTNVDENEFVEQTKEYQEIVSNLTHLNGEINQAQDLVKEFNTLMQRTIELQDKVKTISLRSKKELSEISRSCKKLNIDDKKTKNPTLSQDLAGATLTLQRRLDTLREVRPETRSFFSRIILGRVNVKCFSDREKCRLRDEYNKFKVRTTAIFIFFPLVVLFFHYYLRQKWLDTHWINIFHHLWLLYYFVSLALRENILLVNGSNIRPWWIYHHYLSAAGTVVWIVWPLTDLYLSYVPYVTCLLLYTGIVQGLQILFYRNRDYASRALGKTGHMDISYPETLTELPKELLILVPFLFIAQIWQMSLGLSFLKTFFTESEVFEKHWTEFREELQVLASGIFSIILGGGNFISTVLTVYSKTNLKRTLLLAKEDKEKLEKILSDASPAEGSQADKGKENVNKNEPGLRLRK